MKISEMIKILSDFKDKYGDLDCGHAIDTKIDKGLKYIRCVEKLIDQIDEVE